MGVSEIKVKHIVPLVVLILVGFFVFKHIYNQKVETETEIPGYRDVHHPKNIVSEKEFIKDAPKKEKQEKAPPQTEEDHVLHVPDEHLDISKFVEAEKHVEKAGCPVIEHCEHLICPGPEYDRIIRFKKNGCRECACILG